jgi:DNA-binding MurR/RpiR family transcriptional regulator
MRDSAEKLPGRQEQALAALLNNPTVRDAAKAAQLSEATVYRYMREQPFAARLREARRGLVEQLTTRLQAKSDASAKVLTDIAEDDSKPASVRVAAAKAVIDYTLKAFELGDLSERLKVLEATLESQKKGRR